MYQYIYYIIIKISYRIHNHPHGYGLALFNLTLYFIKEPPDVIIMLNRFSCIEPAISSCTLLIS